MRTSAKKCLLSSSVFKPRPENSDSDEKDALFGLDTQITIFYVISFQQYKLLNISSAGLFYFH
jgi:hypothetical protein